MKKIALIFGGTSPEKLVSVASAQNVVQYFKEPELFFIDERGRWLECSISELVNHKNPFTEKFSTKGLCVSESLEGMKGRLNKHTVFLGLHGTEGEDGTIQKFFESNEISFTGSGSISSHLCFDKVLAKKKAQENDFLLSQQLQVNFTMGRATDEVFDFLNKHKKIVMKPQANGSSFGLYIISSSSELVSATEEIRKHFSGDYLCEAFISGRELTVGVYESTEGVRALAASEVILERGSHFDYQGKYLGKGSQEITPANLTFEEKNRCQQLAIKAHQIFNCYGYSRTDMILTNEGPFFLETNTLPGLTKASFYPQQLNCEKISFQEFVDNQIALAEKRKNID